MLQIVRVWTFKFPFKKARCWWIGTWIWKIKWNPPDRCEANVKELEEALWFFNNALYHCSFRSFSDGWGSSSSSSLNRSTSGGKKALEHSSVARLAHSAEGYTDCFRHWARWFAARQNETQQSWEQMSMEGSNERGYAYQGHHQMWKKTRRCRTRAGEVEEKNSWGAEIDSTRESSLGETLLLSHNR